jgi:hypothetical protein
MIWAFNVGLDPSNDEERKSRATQIYPVNHDDAYMNRSPSHFRALLVPHGDHPRPSRMLPADTPWPYSDQVCRQCFQERSKHVLSRLKHFRISREEQWKLRGYYWHYGAD